jgi:hypothetical protein
VVSRSTQQNEEFRIWEVIDRFGSLGKKGITMRPPVAKTGELYERAVNPQVQVGRRASVAHQLHLP